MKHFEPQYNERGDSPVDLSGREGYDAPHTPEALTETDLFNGMIVLNPRNDKLATITALDGCANEVEYHYAGRGKVLHRTSTKNFVKTFQLMENDDE